MLSSANSPSPRFARAIGYMAIAIVGYSMTPVMVGIASGGDTPLVYNAVMRFGYSISVAVFLFAFYGSLLRSAAVLKVLGRRLLHWHVVLIFLGQFEIGLLAWATRFVDISVATILMESWPILLVFLVGRWFTARDRYVKPTPALVLLLTAGFAGVALVILLVFLVGRWFTARDRYVKPTPALVLLLTAGFAGVALVILSQGVGGDGFYGGTLVAPFLGFLLALCAALCIALSGLGVSWGIDVGKDLAALPDLKFRRESLELFGALVVSFSASLLVAILAGSLALSGGEEFRPGTLLVALIAGLTFVIPNVSWRLANLVSTTLAINALAYATPLLSLVWLALLSQIGAVRMDPLLLGAVLIVASNVGVSLVSKGKSSS